MKNQASLMFRSFPYHYLLLLKQNEQGIVFFCKPLINKYKRYGMNVLFGQLTSIFLLGGNFFDNSNICMASAKAFLWTVVSFTFFALIIFSLPIAYCLFNHGLLSICILPIPYWPFAHWVLHIYHLQIAHLPIAYCRLPIYPLPFKHCPFVTSYSPSGFS